MHDQNQLRGTLSQASAERRRGTADLLQDREERLQQKRLDVAPIADRIGREIVRAQPGDTVRVKTEAEWEFAHEVHETVCPTKAITLVWAGEHGYVLRSVELGSIGAPNPAHQKSTVDNGIEVQR